MSINKQLIISVAALTGLIACSAKNEGARTEEVKKAIWPKIISQVAKDENVEVKVKQLLSNMTLAQKVAQMIQPEIRDITIEDMRKYGFGSYLNGGGAFPNNDKQATAQDWIKLAEDMYQASIDDSIDGSTIPTMWGTDAVHGHNNVIGATLFPHNIGLGAANNPELIEKIAQVTATEVMVTGIDWVFAPTVATVRDDRWGRTYEGYSEDPKIVKTYAGAIVKGLQGSVGNDFLGDDKVISTVKHFIGDGGTVDGDDQGNNISSEQALHDIHGQGYIGGLTAGAQSVMASFNSWQGEKAHGNRYLLTDVLKQKMGFDGFVVGDWNGHGQVKGCSNESCPQAVNSGLDIFMVPTKAWKSLLENTIEQVEQGIIAQSRIDDAVTRILRVKVRAGLFDKPSPANRVLSGKTELIGSKAHRLVAQQAVRESLVLLKNKANLLPLSPKINMLVAGDAAHNIGKQAGGWTITWQGNSNVNNDFPGGSSIYDGLATQVKAAGGQIVLSEDGSFIQKPDVAVVVFGEEPYAEGQGDVEDLAYQKAVKSDLKLLRKLKAQGIPVVSLFISGRPMWINAELNASDAFVAAWLPGSEGKAIADVLLKDKDNRVQHDFKGKLSFSWPKAPDQIVNIHDEEYHPLLPYGFGLRYGDKNLLADNLSETFDLTKGQTTGLNIFTGKIVEPWIASLTSEQQFTAIASNTVSLPGIKYRTVDKKVQEDAFRIELDGSKYAGVQFIHTTADSDRLSSGLITHSRLLVNMKRDSEINSPVYITINCDASLGLKGHCDMQQDISKQLALLPKGQWSDLSIDATCFSNNEGLLSANVTALQLSTAAALNLSISDIHFQPIAYQNTDIRCD
ncbi:beta-glucosidase [Pseudoalteromonas sp. NBT06-2]|uniref:glycoside hydrolase family 3 protein n=1 Tax=Pseudoalteromonas sp. NBT06-2 TaxID=2025950 RepID=UPI000BA52D84|nr:glycoside hydrolase family 3 protein [Pseudoalteromonas sp. NBT06-2]PAJ76220.1 beta-glucosidase [Pseudoalteromonas sp. NBT06-2]